MTDNPDGEVKQVIVMRTDLGMRKGKMIAQGAHASISWLTSHGQMVVYRDNSDVELPNQLIVNLSRPQTMWVKGRFTKICLRADSEEELITISENASKSGLFVALIKDAGLTEFHGVPTNTCCAIGPDYSDKIDAVTGELKLL